MNASNHDEVIDLFAKYFAGEASPEEAMFIDAWLSEPGHKEEYDWLLLLWNKLPGSAETITTPELHQEWNALEKQTNRRPAIRWFRGKIAIVLAAAAVIGVILMI